MHGKNIFSPGQRKLFIAAILFLFIPKLVNSYFLMPFPGSMDVETMQFSYWLDKVADFFLFASGPVVLWGCAVLIVKGGNAKKAGALLLLISSVAFYYYALIEYSAEQMFREPEQVIFKNAGESVFPPDAYVMGVAEGNEAKAYPVRYLAYHHKLHDRLNGREILVTYCSMCRSGRVFRPEVEGEPVTFRLVGARHYNAVMEDSKTGTWWYQATGEAAAGPLKGSRLEEIYFEQATWKNWSRKHPNTLLMQGDPASLEIYDEWFAKFDSMRSPPDTGKINKKLWVVGIRIGENAAAYKLTDLVKYKTVNDQVNDKPLVIIVSDDSLTTYSYFRTLKGQLLTFHMDASWKHMKDEQTGSVWNLDGTCIEGTLSGSHLVPVQHYNEYLRSWTRFNPATTIWKPASGL